jgi:hypothetical protein
MKSKAERLAEKLGCSYGEAVVILKAVKSLDKKRKSK